MATYMPAYYAETLPPASLDPAPVAPPRPHHPRPPRIPPVPPLPSYPTRDEPCIEFDSAPSSYAKETLYVISRGPTTLLLPPSHIVLSPDAQRRSASYVVKSNDLDATDFRLHRGGYDPERPRGEMYAEATKKGWIGWGKQRVTVRDWRRDAKTVKYELKIKGDAFSYVDQSQSLLTWSPVRLFSSYALLPPSLSISDPHCLFTPFSKSPSCPSLHGSEHHRCGLACTETGADGLVGRLEVLSRFEAEVGEGEEGEMDKDLMILTFVMSRIVVQRSGKTLCTSAWDPDASGAGTTFAEPSAGLVGRSSGSTYRTAISSR